VPPSLGARTRPWEPWAGAFTSRSLGTERAPKLGGLHHRYRRIAA
jgi:hypothetical protein